VGTGRDKFEGVLEAVFEAVDISMDVIEVEEEDRDSLECD